MIGDDSCELGAPGSLREHGIEFLPVQANMGFSVRKGTIRGMHLQTPPALEAKLIRCTRGSMFDVVLDLRPDSASYGKWYGEELSAENGRMLYVPELCAHGYQTLEDDTEMHYMTSQFYTPRPQAGCDSTTRRSALNGLDCDQLSPNRIAIGRSSNDRS